MTDSAAPRSFSEVASILSGAVAQGRPIRIVGSGTKLDWSAPGPAAALRLQTAQLSRVIVHQDRASATVDAGTPLVRAQAIFARSGRMLAIDPQLGRQAPTATVGGVLATADSGPLSHRYGGPGEQVLGLTAALADGTVTRTGPRGDDRRHGFELTRLLVGSCGTLGVILSADVRLLPLPSLTATALAASDDPRRLAETVATIADLHDCLEALDIAWRDGRGGLLAQVAGDEAEPRARSVAATMAACGLDSPAVSTDDAQLWARQRAGQRSPKATIIRVHHDPAQLEALLRLTASLGATMIGRAALGVAYLQLGAPRIDDVRAALPPEASAVLLDAPEPAAAHTRRWPAADGPKLALLRDIKAALDPAGVCGSGTFMGGI